MKQEKIPTYEILKKKEKKSIEILYIRYGRKLRDFAIRTWKLDEDSAIDIVYKTLFKIVESIDNYDFISEERFASFVFTLFMNFLKNFHRDDKKRKESVDIFYNDDLEKFETCKSTELNGDVIPNNKMILLQQELDKMNDWERMLLLLRAQDMPYSEIARYIDKPEEQLKVYHQRLKAKLTEKINEQILNNETHNA